MVSITLTGTGSFENSSIIVKCNDPKYYCDQTNITSGACGNANKSNGDSENIYGFSVTNYNQFRISYMHAITAEVISVYFMYHVK